jgi:hypothetical protein
VSFNLEGCAKKKKKPPSNIEDVMLRLGRFALHCKLLSDDALSAVPISTGPSKMSLSDKHKIVQTGCSICRKHFGTVEQFKRHITEDVLPPLLNKLSAEVK